jgi:hypothetical protein
MDIEAGLTAEQKIAGICAALCWPGRGNGCPVGLIWFSAGKTQRPAEPSKLRRLFEAERRTGPEGRSKR